MASIKVASCKQANFTLEVPRMTALPDIEASLAEARRSWDMQSGIRETDAIAIVHNPERSATASLLVQLLSLNPDISGPVYLVGTQQSLTQDLRMALKPERVVESIKPSAFPTWLLNHLPKQNKLRLEAHQRWRTEAKEKMEARLSKRKNDWMRRMEDLKNRSMLEKMSAGQIEFEYTRLVAEEESQHKSLELAERKHLQDRKRTIIRPLIHTIIISSPSPSFQVPNSNTNDDSLVHDNLVDCKGAEPSDIQAPKTNERWWPVKKFMMNSRHHTTQLVWLVPTLCRGDKDCSSWLRAFDHLIVDPELRPLSDYINRCDRCDIDVLPHASFAAHIWEDVVSHARTSHHWIAINRCSISPNVLHLIPKSPPNPQPTLKPASKTSETNTAIVVADASATVALAPSASE
jgi:hypothetical protein